MLYQLTSDHKPWQLMKILITHSYFLHFDPKQLETARPYPPLGTLYASSVLKQNDFDIEFYDSMFDHNTEIAENKIRNTRPSVFIIYDDGFNYLTKMCLTNMRDAALKMIRTAKHNDAIVIISSSDSTDHFEKYLQAGADYVLTGEAELSLVELLASIRSGSSDTRSIEGIVYMENESIVKNKKRDLIRDLDSIPFPAWELLDIEPYKKMWMSSAGYFSINMSTTRGCPFKCNWCAKPIYGNRYHSRSALNVASEIEYLKSRFDIDHIWFSDDIFGLKPGWIQEFANILSEKKIRIPFKIQARADLLCTEQTVKALSDAGCDTVWMGAESGSQKILDAMDKGTTVSQIEEATKLLRSYGIKPCFFIQFGYPGETQKDIALTIEMILKLMPAELGISVSYPLPGTAFFEKVRSELETKSN